MVKWKELIIQAHEAEDKGNRRECRKLEIEADEAIRGHFYRILCLEGEEMGLGLDEVRKWMDLDRQIFDLKVQIEANNRKMAVNIPMDKKIALQTETLALNDELHDLIIESNDILKGENDGRS